MDGWEKLQVRSRRKKKKRQGGMTDEQRDGWKVRGKKRKLKGRRKKGFKERARELGGW